MTPNEILPIVVGSAATTVGIIMFVILILMNSRHGYIEFEQILKPIKANITRMRLFIIGCFWRIKFLGARKSAVPSQPQLSRLPAGIKVVRQNTTRPLSMYHLPCPKCGRNVRKSAAFCPNCGTPLASHKTIPKPTIDLQPLVLGPVSDKLPAIPVTGELDEEVPEIVHIDLMLKVKLYLLWDRAGR